MASSGGRYVKPMAVTRKVRLNNQLAPTKRLMERKRHKYAGFLEEDNIPAEAEVVSCISTDHGSYAAYFSASMTQGTT